MSDKKQQPAGNFTISGGTFTGSTVGYHVEVKRIVQTIGSLPTAEPSEKDELKALVEQLHEALKKASPEQREAAETTVELTENLVIEASKEKPNRTMLKITAEGLKQAAQDIAEVTQTVGRIVGLVLGMVGMN